MNAEAARLLGIPLGRYVFFTAEHALRVHHVLKLANLEHIADQAALEIAARRLKEIEEQLEAASPILAESPAFADGLAGRTAIGSYRNSNLSGVNKEINRVGALALLGKTEAADYVLQVGVREDLSCLVAAYPTTSEEGERLALLDHLLENDAIRGVLAEPTEEAERFRRRFNGAMGSTVSRVSVPELVRRSVDSSATRSRNREPAPDITE